MVIEGQITAFKTGDAERVFSYASLGIRERFGDVQDFVQMVRESCAPLYRPLEVEFLRLTRVERSVVQVLSVTALGGKNISPTTSWRSSPRVSGAGTFRGSCSSPLLPPTPVRAGRS